MKKTKKIIGKIAASAIMLLSSVSCLSVSAEVDTGGIDMSSFNTALNTVLNIIRWFGIPLACIAIAIGGLAIYFGQDGRQWGKRTLIGGLIGLAVVGLGPTLVQGVGALFGL